MNFFERYDMCMTFLRYQEYYESPSPDFRSKSFAILDFMRWYSFKFGEGAFTYATDWAGFNIPDYVIKDVRDLGIPDKNSYDKQMWKVYKECKKKAKGEKFYIIGDTETGGALSHEIAHGFFYINSEYKKEMMKLVASMDPELRKAMDNHLGKLGYASQVFVDEIQANMSTAEDFNNSRITKHNPDVDDLPKRLTVAQKPFVEVFQKYCK